MSKFLFIVPPLVGHVNPTLELGRELLNKGHEVAWLSFDPSLQERIPLGATFLLLDNNLDEAAKEQIKHEIMSISKTAVYGLDSLKFLYEQALNPMNEAMLEGIKSFIDSYNPDIIITDHQVYAGAVAAIQKNIPYATSITAPAAIKQNEALPMIYQWEAQQIISFQKKHGIEDDERVDCSRKLSLVYTSRAMFGDSELPNYFRFVGPVMNKDEKYCESFDFESINFNNDYPKVLVSIGTTFDHSQKTLFFDKVSAALGNEKINVIVVSDPEIFETIPDNFRIHKYIPQVQIMPMLDAVICHGGNNTVSEALFNAKPLVVIPIAYDQSYVATCVVNSGAGIRLNFNRFKAPQLKEALNSILTEKKYTDAAKNIQESFIEAGGAIKAVALLEELSRKKIQN